MKRVIGAAFDSNADGASLRLYGVGKGLPDTFKFQERNWVTRRHPRVMLAGYGARVLEGLAANEGCEREEAITLAQSILRKAGEGVAFNVTLTDELLLVSKYYSKRYGGQRPHTRNTMILRIEQIEGADQFFANFSKLANFELLRQPLYTTICTMRDKWSKIGIGLYSEQDIAQYTLPMDLASVPSELAQGIAAIFE